MEEEEMKIGGLSKRFVFYRNVICTTVLIGVIVSFIYFCYYGVNERIRSLQPTPEQIAFNEWTEKFDGYVENNPGRHVYYSVWFSGSVKEKPRITDEDVRTYFSKVRIKSLFIRNCEMTVQSVASLLDSSYMEGFYYEYRLDDEEKAVYLNSDSKGARLFLQKEILRLAEDPEKDFQTSMFPEEKFDLKEVFLDDESE